METCPFDKSMERNKITNKTVFIILGPTSTGKTSLALELCKKNNGVIISADSRQIFKYMDIGTGKIPIDNGTDVKKTSGTWNFDGVDIFGYDLVHPNENFSVYEYATFAIDKIKKLSEKDKIIFLVGGSGLYIDAVTGNVSIEGAKPNEQLRNDLEKYSLGELQNKLKDLNPEVFAKIDLNNRIRVIRAIEKSTITIPKITFPKLEGFSFKHIGLTASRETLYEKADLWLEHIWHNGLIEETNWLINSEYKESRNLKGLIYKSVVLFINGIQEENEAKQRAKFDLHAYIRRQQTWFKKNNDIHWFNIEEKNMEIIEKIMNSPIF